MADAFAFKRDAKLQARLSAEVDALSRLPENCACADCAGSDSRRGCRFCSVTLGVFLCNRCYGLHRALGAHVTRTKCLGLDTWHPDEVDRLRSVGNAGARRIYEAYAPPGARPAAGAPDRAVAAWIRDKYERRLYCASAPNVAGSAALPDRSTVDCAAAPPAHPVAPPTAPPPPPPVADLLSSEPNLLDSLSLAPPVVPAAHAAASGASASTATTAHGWGSDDWVAFDDATFRPAATSVAQPETSSHAAPATQRTKDQIMALFGP